MEKIKIAHIITKLELGGAQKVVIYTASHLDKNRYSSILISGTRGMLDKDVTNNPDIKSYFIPELVREINPFKDIVALFKIRSLLRKEKIIMVHTHSSKAGIVGRWAARLAGIKKIIHTYHGFGFNDFQNPVVRSLFTGIERITARITKKLIFVSKANVEKASRNNIGRKEKYVIVRAGVDIKKFSNCKIDVHAKKKSLGIKPDAPVAGMVACFKGQKNILDYLRVANLVRIAIPDVKFILVGDGELREKIETGIRELNLSKHFILTGWRNDIEEIMQVFDILISTSLWEGLPCTFLEAMASAKPIVATNVDGVGDVVEDSVNGYLVSISKGYIEKLADYVIKLFKDRALAEKMGAKGSQKLKEEFDTNRMVKDMERVYEEVLG